MNEWTDGLMDGQIENIMPPPARWPHRHIKQITNKHNVDKYVNGRHNSVLREKSNSISGGHLR